MSSKKLLNKKNIDPHDTSDFICSNRYWSIYIDHIEIRLI